MPTKRRTKEEPSSSASPLSKKIKKVAEKVETQIDRDSVLEKCENGSRSANASSSEKKKTAPAEVEHQFGDELVSSGNSKKNLRFSSRKMKVYERVNESKSPNASSSEKKKTAPAEVECLIEDELVSAGKSKKTSRSSSRKMKVDECEKDSKSADPAPAEVDCLFEEEPISAGKIKKSISTSKKMTEEKEESECRFIGDPFPDDEARRRWSKRYDNNKRTKKAAPNSLNGQGDDDDVMQARCHYSEAEVDGCFFNLNDCAFVKGEVGKPDYIGKIVELFESVDGDPYFTAQWFFRAEDTVIKDSADLIDRKQVFPSELRDDNPLDCIVSKLTILRVVPNIDLAAKEETISSCDFYYDMLYSLSYSSFSKFPAESNGSSSEASSTISSDVNIDESAAETKSDSDDFSQGHSFQKSKKLLLDLYSGCGAMSTGLCLGAAKSGVNLITRWAVDLNPYACESLKLNHPESEVRNETAQAFLSLLKEWEKLCNGFSLLDTNGQQAQDNEIFNVEDDGGIDDDGDDLNDGSSNSSEEFEVGEVLAVRYGDPKESDKSGLYFKVRWKGFGPSEDTWEPMQGLSNCEKAIKDFLWKGYKSKILPLPGDVEVICGGPPCQGVSGFNRFRNRERPLEDPKNEQLVVFMDIVKYLKPKYVLMENVVDIMKFAGGFLGRYALARLLACNYQARLGLLVAGCYGLPQFRMRCFLWGAHPIEHLPQFPLPTHEVVVRGNIPTEFEKNAVAYDENCGVKLKPKLVLGDAISDLPAVTNNESRDEMPYESSPVTEFQRHIRVNKHEASSFSKLKSVQRVSKAAVLYDHRPLQLNEDDYQRVCRIPKEKGANFRNLPGVLVRPDNHVEWDESIERVFLPSGKPLVPDYAMSFTGGTSSKPFGRLWWDETVPTVVTRAEPHNQVILHPVQDRVLSIRENARLQGFPDYYKLCGPVKERYIQVGNAVAVPVAQALGYALGLAIQGISDDRPLMTLPQDFPYCPDRKSSSVKEPNDDSS